MQVTLVDHPLLGLPRHDGQPPQWENKQHGKQQLKVLLEITANCVFFLFHSKTDAMKRKKLLTSFSGFEENAKNDIIGLSVSHAVFHADHLHFMNLAWIVRNEVNVFIVFNYIYEINLKVHICVCNNQTIMGGPFIPLAGAESDTIVAGSTGIARKKAGAVQGCRRERRGTGAFEGPRSPGSGGEEHDHQIQANVVPSTQQYPPYPGKGATIPPQHD